MSGTDTPFSGGWDEELRVHPQITPGRDDQPSNPGNQQADDAAEHFAGLGGRPKNVRNDSGATTL